MKEYEVEFSNVEKEKIRNKIKNIRQEKKMKGIVSPRGKIVKRFLHGKILDIGSNNNIFFDEIKNNNTFGIDKFIDREMRISGESGKIICCDAEQMSIKDGCFDCITAGELIEHLDIPKKFLSESYRVLKSGGLLLITTPNKNSWWNMLTGAYNHKFHKNIFTKKSIENILEYAGFSVLYRTSIPYDKYSSPFGRMFLIRRFMDYILPDSLKENMIIVAKKSKGEHIEA